MPDNIDRPARLRELVAETLGQPVATLSDADNLVELGLDSVRVMKIAGLLRREGIRLRFADMMTQPTMDGWLALVGEERS